MKNFAKKATFEDKFARHFWSKKAKANYAKFAKKTNNKKVRQILKSFDEETDYMHP